MIDDGCLRTDAPSRAVRLSLGQWDTFRGRLWTWNHAGTYSGRGSDESRAAALFDFTMNGQPHPAQLERAADPKTNKGGHTRAPAPIILHLHGNRHRDRAGLSKPAAHGRQSQGQNRPARDLGGIFPVRRGLIALFAHGGRHGRAPSCWEGRRWSRRRQGRGPVREVGARRRVAGPREEWVLQASDADIVKPWDQKRLGRCPAARPITRLGFMTFVGCQFA